MIEKMKERDKQILKSVAPLVIVIILFILLGKFGFAQIKDVRNKINQTKKTQSALSQKLKILQEVSVTNEGSSDIVLFALPKSNPSLLVMSQIRILASNNSLVLEEMRTTVGSDDKSGLSSVTTSFNITGARESIVAFVKAIETIAPLSFVQKIGLSQAGGLNTAEISVKTFFGDLPTKIPNLTQAVTNLSQTEKDLLTQIGQLTQPVMGEEVTASTENLNAAPFGE